MGEVDEVEGIRQSLRERPDGVIAMEQRTPLPIQDTVYNADRGAPICERDS